MGRYGAKWFRRARMALFKTGRFVGKFRHNMDDKGRLTIPSAWRPEVESEANAFLALPISDGSITVYPPRMVEKLEAAIAEISLEDAEGQMAIAELMDVAQEFSCDKQGRIKLNEELLECANLKKGAVLLGKVATFSIYSEELYDAMMAGKSTDKEARAAIFKRFGI